jgi:WD40 repeat protein/DNA-binding winged helix-turn-helix (wHTH) protein
MVVEKAHLVYEFGRFRLYAAQRILVHDGEPVALTPKGFETLLALVESKGRILEKDELMKTLWPGNFVEEGNLSQNIFLLRKALGDKRNGSRFIQTVPRRGYKFAASVKEIDAATLGNGFPGAAQSCLPGDYWKRHSPFRGLQVFEPEDAWLFFGRNADTDELLVRLGRSPLLAMVGNSGSGKSSLVRAGLIPALRAGRLQSEGLSVDQWRIAVFRPSAAPFDDLAEVLPHQLAPELGLKEQAEFIADCRNKFPAGGDALRNAICALMNAITEKGNAHVLLVADQFEEIFTLTANPESRRRYIDLLLNACRLDSAFPVHLVLTLRADFYAHWLEHAELSRCLEANLYNVPRMTHEQLRENIEKRLALAGAHAEPGLIDALLEEVGSEPGDLALLEHALGQLWERCGGPGCTLTNQAYAEIGRLRGALGRHADGVYQGLGDEKQKRLAQKLLLELVHLGEGGNVQDTRRRVPKEYLLALGAADEVERLLGRLTSSRLISTGREGEATFVEVSHEALIREWPALREWLAQNREELRLERRLVQLAEEWDGLNRDPGALLQGARLAQAEEWLAKHADAPALLRQFVQASVAARAEAQERELARQKAAASRLRWFSSVLAVLLLVAVGSAWFAYHQQVLEKSRAIAARSGELLPADHGRALDLAIRSWNIAKTDEARFAVAKSFPELLFTSNHDDAVYRAVFSPDGQRILSTSYDHSARLWNARDGHLLAILTHDARVEHAEFSADGQRIVTASDDLTARVWNGTNGRLLAVLKGHKDKVWRASFSPDGKCVLTASFDHTARIWDGRDGRLLMKLEGHSDSVLGARFSSDGQRIVTVSQDKTARVCSSASGQLLVILQGHSGMLGYAEFSRDGQRIVTVSYDRTARVWNSADGRLLTILKHEGPVTRAVFSPDGRRVATASYDNTARIWNSEDGRLLATLKHEGRVQHVEFSPDGRHIVTASFDHTARVWNSSDGRLLAILQGHSREVYHAAFSPSGDEIVTGSGDHTIRTWSLMAGWSAAVLRHGSAVMSAAFSPDGKLIATAAGNAAQLWNTSDGHLQLTLPSHSDQVWQVAFSPDGKRIVTASKDRTARLWNSADGRLLFTLQGHTDQVGYAAFSPDGERIVTSGYDHTARVWNGADGRLLATLQGHTARVLRAEFSADGRRIVTASFDNTTRVWNAADGRLLYALRGHTDQVWMARFSPDGQRIVTAGKDHLARVWRGTDGKLLTAISSHTGEVIDAEFSPDNQRIITASFDQTARVWSSADGRLLVILRGHADALRRATFSPDGKRILTASYDNTARVWSSADGRLLATLQGHSGLLLHATFSRDGQHIATTSEDGTARLWQVLTLDDIERILAK